MILPCTKTGKLTNLSKDFLQTILGENQRIMSDMINTGYGFRIK